jgi:hypothetical protein
MLSQMKVTTLEEILVVQEYPDVFPEELPGMPPDRDIEFLIKLLTEHHLFLRDHIEYP